MTSLRRALVVTKNDFTAELDGGSKRTANVVRALEMHGFIVDWVAMRPGSSSEYVPVARGETLRAAIGRIAHTVATRSGSTAKWYEPRSAAVLRKLSRMRHYDAAVIEHSQLAPLRSLVRADAVVIDTHNVESELLANYASSTDRYSTSAIARYESHRLKLIEDRLANDFDIVAGVSKRDIDLLSGSSAHTRAELVVCPNGVSDEFFSVEGPRGKDIVFIGHLGWRPNIDAAIWLADQVWPHVAAARPDLTLRLIGRDPDTAVTRLASATIVVEANVPSVIPHLSSARVATAPLLSAGGTRIKILEALASGTPVVSTKLGALGLEELAGDHLTIADTAQEFAAEVVRVAANEYSRDTIREFVRPFSWAQTMRPLVDAIDAHLAPSGNA